MNSGFMDEWYRNKANEEIKRTTNRCGLVTNECPARVSKNNHSKLCDSCLKKYEEGFERIVGPTGLTTWLKNKQFDYSKWIIKCF